MNPSRIGNTLLVLDKVGQTPREVERGILQVAHIKTSLIVLYLSVPQGNYQQ